MEYKLLTFKSEEGSILDSTSLLLDGKIIDNLEEVIFTLGKQSALGEIISFNRDMFVKFIDSIKYWESTGEKSTINNTRFISLNNYMFKVRTGIRGCVMEFIIELNNIQEDRLIVKCPKNSCYVQYFGNGSSLYNTIIDTNKVHKFNIEDNTKRFASHRILSNYTGFLLACKLYDVSYDMLNEDDIMHKELSTTILDNVKLECTFLVPKGCEKDTFIENSAKFNFTNN